MAAENPHPSQTSSHAPLEPISGTTLLHAELHRRAALPGPCATGCRELDEAALASGGFERGCVVGVSAEEDDVALVLGLQTIVRRLLRLGVDGGGGARRPRAMIVTTMGVGSLVGVLRGVLRAQEGVVGQEREREVLGRVAVARVFDVNGLWEVLGELDALGAGQEIGAGGLRTDDDDKEVDEGGGSLLDGGGGGSAAPARGIGADSGCEGIGVVGAEVPDVAEDGQHGGVQIRYMGEPPSSPLSDPPSDLPDTPPWETVEAAGGHTEMAGTDKPDTRKTPPGQREEIQDSEGEEGFSPLVFTNVSPQSSSAKLPEPRFETGALGPGQHDALSSSVDLSCVHEQDDPQVTPSPAQAIETPDLDREEEPSASTGLQDAQEGNDEVQPKASPSGATKPVATHNPPEPSCKNESTHPDIILITHMSTLLSSLFHQREKATAHQSLQLLASHLRHLARSTEYGSPLVMILNSTTSSETHVTAPAQFQDRDGPPRPPLGGPSTPDKPLDPTLRSIFNPPPLPVSGLAYNYDTPQSRRNKPSFGLIFTQLLDLHLLCTKIPKTRADAEALYALASPGTGRVVEYVWAVEVLLDEIGVWEGSEKVLEGRPRRSREQRWGAVEVRRDGIGVRIVDAFGEKAQALPQEVVVSAGFGGRRV